MSNTPPRIQANLGVLWWIPVGFCFGVGFELAQWVMAKLL